MRHRRSSIRTAGLGPAPEWPDHYRRGSCARPTLRLARKWWNGRHAGLRSWCRKAWGFESPLPHQVSHPVTGGASMASSSGGGHGALSSATPYAWTEVVHEDLSRDARAPVPGLARLPRRAAGRPCGCGRREQPLHEHAGADGAQRPDQRVVGPPQRRPGRRVAPAAGPCGGGSRRSPPRAPRGHLAPRTRRSPEGPAPPRPAAGRRRGRAAAGKSA